MQQRREQAEQEEAATILRQIEAEYETENGKVIEQKKALAEQNMKVTVIQRKIESCPSNVEITQFTKRLFELFDNFNFKSEENRKYCNLFNTLVDSKKYFNLQLTYMREINETYKNAKKKKEREVLLHNIKNISGIMSQKCDQSVSKLNACRQENKETLLAFDECNRNEKEHFQRIRQLEDAVTLQGELAEKFGGNLPSLQ